METEERHRGATWRWSLLLSIAFINICLPSLVLSYGVVWIHLSNLEVPLWFGLSTPSIFLFTYSFTQCWFREAADSWGGPVGYRIMGTLGLTVTVIGLFLCAFLPFHLHPFIYGILGGLGSSLISAQVDAIIFETYDTRLGIVRGICFTGQAVGLSLFPHILTVLIEVYGYSFMFIVLAGITLQTLPAIMLLRLDDSLARPASFSRYKDLPESYVVYGNEGMDNYLGTELQLHYLSKKCWQSPSDDNLHREVDYVNDENEFVETITPPPSPEEKRRNIFGVDILPEIPEESEESDNDEQCPTDTGVDKKKRVSVAIKRLSILSDNLDEFITKQIRKDSEGEGTINDKEYTELEVTYENVSPNTDIHTEKIFNSFGFRCRSAYTNMRRKLWIPSYRMYRIRRRFLYFMYSINDTFTKPLTRSLSCWNFYPALLLSFGKLSLNAVSLALMPMIAMQVQPKISIFETNFLMSLHAFTWLCFLLCTPWLAQTPKRNFKYVAVVGLIISTVACFVLAEANNHDSFSIGCVVAGFGYGAISSSSDTAIQDFVGARKWPKLHSTLETLSATMLIIFVVGLSFIVGQEGGLQYSMFILGTTLSIITTAWLIIAIYSAYTTKLRTIWLRRNWFL